MIMLKMSKITNKNWLNYFLNTTIIIVVFLILIKNKLIPIDYLISINYIDVLKTIFIVSIFIISKLCYYGFVYVYPFLALLLVFFFKDGIIGISLEKNLKITKFISFYLVNAILLYFSLSIVVKKAITIYNKAPNLHTATGDEIFYLIYLLCFIYFFITLLFYKKR